MTLVDNIALLLAASLLHGIWIGRVDRSKWLAQGVSGGIFGLAVLVAMSKPLVLSSGVVFDGRSIVISLAGMFGGPLVAGITGALAILHRLHRGGGGSLTGVLVIVTSAVIGTGFYYRRQRKPILNSMPALFGFGLLVHVNMLVWMLFLPSGAVLSSYKAVAFPVMTVYPVATLLLGMLLVNLEEKESSVKALRASQERLRLLIDQSGATLWSVDHALRFTSTVGERLTQLGLPPERLLGKSLYEFFQTDNPDLPPLVAHRAALAGEPVTYEHVWDGVHYRVHVEPHIDPSGHITEVVGIAYDVTELKQSQEKLAKLNAELEQRVKERTRALEHANRDLETFAYSVSHDLRAPLRAISGFSQIITRRHQANLNEEGQHYFDNIVQASAQMGRLIDDLLQLSRLGRKAVQLETVSLTRVFSGLDKKFRGRANEEGVQFICPQDGPEIRTDPTLLDIILTNLVDNALTYRVKEGSHQVEVRYQRNGDAVTLSVMDNGIGIAPEYQEKIYDVFQRLNSQTVYPGTGIGLAMTDKAAQLLGARITLVSEPDKGSVFLIELPLALGV